MRRTFVSALLSLATLTISSIGLSAPVYDRGSWSNWRGSWTGDFWSSGNLGYSQYMTCVANDGSDGAPEFWAAGHGEHAARQAYQQCLDYVNVADRNPAYISVECGY